MRDWTLLQIEGEKPIEIQAVDDSKAVKGKPPPAKGAPPTKAAGGALEEITDNRPRVI